MAKNLMINGESIDVSDQPEQMPLLWFIRDHLHLTGTKYGCGKALCGACTVLVEGTPTRSCQLPLSVAEGRDITTIEGLVDVNQVIREVWVEQNVAQCGYCQSGQIVAATALLQSNPNPSEQEIESALVGNLCRCGTYSRIKAAIQTAAQRIQQSATEELEGE